MDKYSSKRKKMKADPIFLFGLSIWYLSFISLALFLTIAYEY
nr:MAG TPA: hypothetical protein [Caudoviricetes sp.]